MVGRHAGARSSCWPPASTASARASFGTLVGLAAAALLCTRFDFPFLAARAYIDIPYLALRRVGRARWRPSGRGAAAPSSCCWPAPGSCAPRRGCSAACTGCGASLPATWPQRVRYARRSTGAPPVDLDGPGLVGDRRPEVLADAHQRPGRGARAHQRRAGRRAQRDACSSCKNLDKVPVFYAGARSALVIALAAHAAARAHAAGAAGRRPRHVRARRRRRAVGHRPLPARARRWCS